MSINARNVNSTAGIPKSLTEVIAFLTRPLVMFYTPSEIAALEVILKTTLTAPYFASREPHLFLMLSPASQPPRPILAACIAACVRWADWIIVLGGKELDILVEPSRAVIRYGGQSGTIKTIWQESSVYRPQLRVQVPPSIHERPSGSFLRATVDSAVSRAQGRTKAQELLASNDKEETDEIFALLSNVTGITPTPTFEQFQIDNPSSGSSPDSSRPSSRSSNFSFFSLASSTDSICTRVAIARFSPGVSCLAQRRRGLEMRGQHLGSHKLLPLVGSAVPPPTATGDAFEFYNNDALLHDDSFHDWFYCIFR